MLSRPLLLAVLAALALAGASCGGGDGNDADGAITFGDQAANSDTGDDSGGSGEGGAGSDGLATSDGGDLQVVWPLPPGEFAVWLPYQLIEDEFQYSESASFQTMSVSMEEVLEFYRGYFPTIGLVPNELPLGESIAMNLTNPDDPLWSGVMQTGVDPEGYVTVNQNYTDPRDPGETTTTAGPGAVSSEADGMTSEDG